MVRKNIRSWLTGINDINNCTRWYGVFSDPYHYPRFFEAQVCTMLKNIRSWLTGINYSRNGNITQYQRRGLTTGTTYGQIDLMVYTYDATNPDRLSRIADLAPSANRPYGFKPKGVPAYYGYDNAGNMTSDGHKDLTVAYNALNLPDVFTFASNRRLKRC